MPLTYSFDINTFDFDVIHRWLAGTYWSPGITKERVIRGFQHSSIVIGAFEGVRQVGVGRCITDTTRFAYIADVFVDRDFRKQGIARQMVTAILAHPDVSDADRCFLFTKDAHGVYQPIGFGSHPNPDHLMVRRKPLS